MIASRRLLAFAVALAIGSAFNPTLATAAGFADLGVVDRAVTEFTGAPAGAIGGATQPVDRRLRLAACAAPLALSWRGDRHDTVLVQCPDVGGWHLFVALRGSSVPTAGAAAVARGEEVTVEITGDGFTVSQSGEALENGAIGDWIRVNPVQGGKAGSDPIRAQVVRPGLVSVLLP